MTAPKFDDESDDMDFSLAPLSEWEREQLIASAADDGAFDEAEEPVDDPEGDWPNEHGCDDDDDSDLAF